MLKELQKLKSANVDFVPKVHGAKNQSHETDIMIENDFNSEKRSESNVYYIDVCSPCMATMGCLPNKYQSLGYSDPPTQINFTS